MAVTNFVWVTLILTFSVISAIIAGSSVWFLRGFSSNNKNNYSPIGSPSEIVVGLLIEKPILSANPDGTNRKLHIKDTDITPFALDFQHNDMYWSKNNDVFVKRANSHEDLKVVSVSSEIISLAVLNDTLYVTSRDVMEGTNILFECKLDEGICKDELEATKYDSDMEKLRPYTPFEYDYGDPCSIDNGNCEHLCILSDNYEKVVSYKCVCNVGWELQDDLRSCSPINEYVMYIRGNYVRGRIMDMSQNNFINAILPMKLKINSTEKSIKFDYNYHKGYLVFSNGNGMYRKDLYGSYVQRTLAEDPLYEMTPVIDWIGDNIYYLKRNKEQSYLMLRSSYGVNPSMENQKTIHVFEKNEVPHAIVIHPELGMIYVTVYDEFNKIASIYWFKTDGSESNVFVKPNEDISIDANSLGIDHQEGRLYWFNKEKTAVQHVSCEPKGHLDVKTVDISIVKNPTYINIHREWMYIGNAYEAWQMDKLSGKYAERILSSEEPVNNQNMLHDVKGYGINLQPIPNDHPCAIDKGGCSHYCTAVYDEQMKHLKKVCMRNDNIE